MDIRTNLSCHKIMVLGSNSGKDVTLDKGGNIGVSDWRESGDTTLPQVIPHNSFILVDLIGNMCH